MDHVGLVLLAVVADIDEVEALREVEVELHGAELPRPAERVLDLHVDLRAVECAAAFIDFVGHAFLVEGVAKRLRGLLPALRSAHGLRGLRGEIRLDVVEAELPEHVLREFYGRLDFLHYLFRGAEDVRVVLREAADAEKPVAHAVLLVAIDGAEFGEAQREVAVGALLELIDLDVEGAVHRLDIVVLHECVVAAAFLHLHDREHAVFVEREVPGGFPEIGFADVRGVDDLVAGFVVLLAPVFLDGDADSRAFRQPVRQPRAHLVGDCEKLQLAAEHAVVALLRLFFARENRVEFRLVLGYDAVDALEHLVLLVAAVVGTCHAGKLDDADLRGMFDVRPAAHFHVVAHGVRGDFLAIRDVGQAFELVALAGQHLCALLAADDLAHERLVERDEPRDLGLDTREVLRRKAVRHVHVVVEAFVRLRADVDLHVVENVHYGARNQVRRGMPPHLVCDFHRCSSLKCRVL